MMRNKDLFHKSNGVISLDENTQLIGEEAIAPSPTTKPDRLPIHST